MKRCQIFTLSLLLLFLNSCAPKPPQELTPTEAHQKLIRLLKEEFNLDVVIKSYENTLWIYLPLNEPYLKYVATPIGPIHSSEKKSKFFIKYLDGEFQEDSFRFTYDIVADTEYKNDRGITSKFTEEFTIKQQFILKAISLAYGDVEKDPHGDGYVEGVPGDRDFLGHKENASHKRLVHAYVKTDKVPDFFVIIIADIYTGIEMKMYLYLQDLRRAFYDQGFGEEYIRRLIVDQPVGHEKIIGDKTGKHIESYDLSWQEFLMKQMIHRTTFKYQQSAFPPSDDTRTELLNVAADTIHAYDFEDFTSIELQDLDHNTTFKTAKEDLAGYRSEPPSKGRLIHIKFGYDEDGEAELDQNLQL